MIRKFVADDFLNDAKSTFRGQRPAAALSGIFQVGVIHWRLWACTELNAANGPQVGPDAVRHTYGLLPARRPTREVGRP
jgi:hypothetical protein